ncbi:MAG: glycosyltransferase family 39 protein [Bacteroidota bacterium]
MAFTYRQALPYIILSILAIPLFFLNIYNVHSWGDDFSQYIKEAQNIAHGRPYYLSNYVFNKYNPVYAPPQYPPGFPLMLAPVVKIWGLSFTAMCYFNSVIIAALLFALYAFFRKYAGIAASICLAVLIAYSGFMIDLKKNILADAPSLLFVVIYLTLRRSNTFSWRRILALVLLAAAAIQTRSQTIFLLPAEAIFLAVAVIRNRFKVRSSIATSMHTYPSAYIIAGVVILNLLLDKVIFATPISTSGFYNNFIKDTLQGHILEYVSQYIGYVFTTFTSYFHYEAENGFARLCITIVEAAAITLSLAGFAIKCRRNFEVHDIFFLIMCLLILFYPVRDTRYFLPAVPVLYLYCYIALRALLPLVTPVKPSYIAVAITCIYLLAGSAYLKKAATEITPGCIPAPKDIAAFSYLSTHVKDNEIIVFTKPRALTLFTNRKAMNVSWQQSLEQNRKVFDSLGVKYMLVIDGFEDGFFKDYLRTAQPTIDSARIAEGYMLYTLR